MRDTTNYRGRYYYCKRLRMLEYLRNKGFLPTTTIPDMNNPRYNIWLFEWTDDFDSAMKEYFATGTFTSANK